MYDQDRDYRTRHSSSRRIAWHGSAHTHLGIELSTEQTLFVYIIVIIAPVVAAILVWTRYLSTGLWVFFLSMLGSFLFGAYHH
jgi:hypothetical protein